MGLRLAISFVLLFSHCICLEAQPHLTRVKTFGGTSSDGFYNGVVNQDGSMLLVGGTISDDGMIQCQSTESNRIWLVKVSDTWNVVWQQCYGYPDQDRMSWVLPYRSNHYVLFGYNRTHDSTYVPCWKGSQDVILWEVDSVGNRLTQYCYGGTSIDLPHHVTQSKDGGYLVAGESMSDDQDLHPHYGQLFSSDAWIFKLDTLLNIEWSLQWGGTDMDLAWYVTQHPYNGYFALATSKSSDGDVGNNQGSFDSWLLRLNDTGAVVWKKQYGGVQDDRLTQIVVDGDSILYLVGRGNSDVCGAGGKDLWVVKTDFNGNVIWQNCFGGSLPVYLRDAFITNDQLTLVTYALASDGDVNTNYGLEDIWILLLERSGQIVSSKNFGGSEIDIVLGLVENKYLIGFTKSDDHDIPNVYGGSDALLMEIEIWPVGIRPSPSNPNGYSFQVTPTLFDGRVTISRSETLEEHYQVHVTDLLGRVVQSALWDSGLESLTLKTNNLVSGAYLLSIQDESGSVLYVEKLVKAR